MAMGSRAYLVLLTVSAAAAFRPPFFGGSSRLRRVGATATADVVAHEAAVTPPPSWLCQASTLIDSIIARSGPSAPEEESSKLDLLETFYSEETGVY